MFDVQISAEIVTDTVIYTYTLYSQKLGSKHWLMTKNAIKKIVLVSLEQPLLIFH